MCIIAENFWIIKSKYGYFSNVDNFGSKFEIFHHRRRQWMFFANIKFNNTKTELWTSATHLFPILVLINEQFYSDARYDTMI